MKDLAALRVRYQRDPLPVQLGGLETMELLRLSGYRSGVLPFTWVIDRSGNIARQELGGLREARLDSIIRPLL